MQQRQAELITDHRQRGKVNVMDESPDKGKSKQHAVVRVLMSRVADLVLDCPVDFQFRRRREDNAPPQLRVSRKQQQP